VATHPEQVTVAEVTPPVVTVTVPQAHEVVMSLIR
jgi:hypothetical protein